MKKLLTLCIIHESSRVLLGMKKRGFGAGRWNGFGGKLEEGETIEDAAKREIFEEAGITAHNLEKRGVIEFEFSTQSGQKNAGTLEVHVFQVRSFTGAPEESEEMKPQWFSIDAIPYDTMWPDDIHWLPLFLAGKKFKGRFSFGENDTILSYTLEETDILE